MKQRVVTNMEETPFDKYLLFSALIIAGLGLMMVASASIVISEKYYHWPFHFLVHQMLYLGLGCVAGFFVFRMNLDFLERHSKNILLIVIVMLVLVLIPGIGHHVNGSARWVGFGPLRLQVSELAKLSCVIYMASYFVRNQVLLRESFMGFMFPMIVLGVIGILLLLEPDFGATVVIVTTVMGMMFMGGVRLRYFALLLVGMAAIFALLAISAPYRLERLTAFLNPWANQYGSGYQLTQSLIAFGRGGWFGVGLGASIQKLFYLPEAHTDFLFAVIAEELGLVGITVIIGLYTTLIYRIVLLGKRAQKAACHFEGLMAYGFAFWLAIQFMVNIGVNAGILPTKGLTLPLMSYGGSSVLVNCIVIAILLKIDVGLRKNSTPTKRHKTYN